MKKALLALCLFIISAAYADYANRLPPSLTLQGGANETHKAIADCSSSSRQCTFGYRQPAGGYDFTYTTSGNTKSTLTLNATLPPNPTSSNTNIPFYINSATINPYSNLILNDFDSILLENRMSIDNATLTFNADTTSNSTIFQMNSNSSVELSNQATLKVKANSFLNKNIVSISNSTLDISAISVFSYNKIQNDNGMISINGNFYNVGQKITLGSDESGIANFINNGGIIVIVGNILNGGHLYPAYNCRAGGVCGGGNIINKGGTIDISGQLISQQNDGQVSTIQIYGGTLIVGGGLQNKEGSTLIFGMLNGQMGMLKGSLTNTGQVVIDANGMVNVGNYTIIEGQITGLDSDNIAFINRSDFFDVSYKDGSVSVTEASSGGGGSGGGVKPPTKMEVFKSSLYGNETSIFNALSSKLGGDMEFFKHFDTEKTAKEALTTTEQLIKESYVAQPQTMINALQSNALPLPVPKRIAMSRRTAASEIIRFDNGKRVSPFAKKVVRAPKNRNFYFNPLGAILRADNLTGYIAGFTLGTNYEARNYASQIYVAYAYGESSQDFDTQSTDTTGNLFQAGFLNRYSYSVFELETNANLLAGVFKLKNEWANATMLNSTASFGDYQLNLGLIAGAKLGKRLSFKPFAGIQNYFEFREGFKQDGGLQVESKGYNAYIIDGILGVEGRYIFNELASVYGKFSFESRLYNTHKEMLMWAFDNELRYENKSYDNALSLSIGTQILTWYDFNLDAELLYKHYNNGLNYFGGSFMFKYAF